MEENSNQTEMSPFNKEQLELLQKMFGQVQSAPATSTIRSRSLAQKGNFLSALIVRGEQRPWIVDSDASNHMTGNATIFHNYNPCNENHTINTEDGSLSKVAGTSSVIISKDLTPNFVLLVPNLDCNLLSISKLTQELNCVTKFGANFVNFKT